jgi:hypothetical protein
MYKFLDVFKFYHSSAYFFDGNEFDNIRWMVKDIAVVKVEDDFNFKRKIKGCDFIPKKMAFNNITEDLEKPRTVGSTAGWGSIEAFGDVSTYIAIGHLITNVERKCRN